MAFSLNPSIEYVNIDESVLYELYQSTSPVIPDDPSFRGRPCEAYICTAKDGKHLKMYVSFLDTISKQIYVYTPDVDPAGASGYAQLLAQAKEFVAAKGFVVDKVNIDFSSAIRQVIIRSLRIMRPPPAPPKKVLHLVPPVEKASSPAMSDKPVTPDHRQVPPVNVSAPGSPDVEALLAEKEATLQEVRAELAAVKQQREKARKERAEEVKQSTAKFAELQERLDQAVAVQKNTEELLAQAADRQKVLEQDEAGRDASERAVLGEEIATLRHELAEATAAKEVMAEAFEKEMAAIQESLVAAVAEKEAAERQLAAEKDAAAAALESLQAEMAVLKERSEGEKAADGSLIKTLRSELEKGAEAANSEIIGLRDELAAAQASLVHLEQVQSELKDARLELAQLSSDNSTILVELEQLAEEHKAGSAAHADELAQLRAEVDRLTRALLVQEQVSSREQTALRAELRKLVTELANGGTLPLDVSVQPAEAYSSVPAQGMEQTRQQETAVLPAPSAVLEEEHEDEDIPSSGAEEALAILGTEFGSDGSFAAPGEEGTTEFRREADLDAIPYRSSADVLAVYCSINTIQAVPIGNEVQKCSGFVCAVAENGSPRIYIAWHMPESRRVVVLAPDAQPNDKNTCARVLRDAIQYFEIMGFMMEPHDLGATPQKRRSVVKKIPVLRRVEKKDLEHEQPEALKRSA